MVSSRTNAIPIQNLSMIWIVIHFDKFVKKVSAHIFL